MRTVMLVPRRADGGHRDHLWAWVRNWWTERLPELPIFEGHHDDGPFNRSAAINQAAELAGDWDVAVVADADTFADPSRLTAAAEAASKTGKIVFGYTDYRYLTQQGSRQVMDGAQGSWEPFVDWTMRGACSGLVAVSRQLWEQAGGFDEGFRGWGWEDVAFSLTCQAFAGEHLRVHGDVWHLWHPTAETNDKTSPGYLANEARAHRYIDARDDGTLPELLAALGTATVTATVASGNGIAATLPTPAGLVPGTLNVAIADDVEVHGHPDGFIDPWHGGPAAFRHGHIADIPVRILGVNRRALAGWHLELLAPVHLRTALDLADGDPVTLTIGT